MTRVGILQSNYVPWRGYFDLMDDCDVFIIYDEVQYTKSDWRNRNKLKTRTGTSWMTVPVQRDGLATRIDEAKIDWTNDWTEKHRQLVIENYRDAPHFDDVSCPFFAELDRRPSRLSTLNVALLKMAAAHLRIETEIVFSAELGAQGGKTERLVSLVQEVDGDCYLSGPAAESYLDEELFRRAGITLEYKSYDYEPYPQLWGAFEGAVSILDLLLNTGPDARLFIKSQTPNRQAIC
jgi:hypothetical protein